MSGSSDTLVSGLNHAVVVTADMERLCSFYTDVFGITAIEAPAPPGTRVTLLMVSSTAALNIIEAPGSEHAMGSTSMLQRGHIDHIAFEAPSAEALETIGQRLVDRGASDGSVHDYGPFLCVPFTDPDGIASACWVRDATLTDLHQPRPLEGSLLDCE